MSKATQPAKAAAAPRKRRFSLTPAKATLIVGIVTVFGGIATVLISNLDKLGFNSNKIESEIAIQLDEDRIKKVKQSFDNAENNLNQDIAFVKEQDIPAEEKDRKLKALRNGIDELRQTKAEVEALHTERHENLKAGKILAADIDKSNINDKILDAQRLIDNLSKTEPTPITLTPVKPIPGKPTALSGNVELKIAPPAPVIAVSNDSKPAKMLSYNTVPITRLGASKLLKKKLLNEKLIKTTP